MLDCTYEMIGFHSNTGGPTIEMNISDDMWSTVVLCRGLHIPLNPRSRAAVLTGSVPIALKSACIGGFMTLPLESLKSLYASFKLLPYETKNLLETIFS